LGRFSEPDMETGTVQLVGEEWSQACVRASPEWQKILHLLEAPAHQVLRLAGLFLFEFDQDSEQSPLFVLRAATWATTRQARIPLDEEALAFLNRPLEVPLAARAQPWGKLEPLLSAIARPEYRSMLLAPVRYEDRLVGCFAGGSPWRQNFTAGELSLFSLLASFAATVVENMRLRGETAFRLSEAMSLQTITSALVEERSLDAILAVIIAEAIRLTNANDALVLLLEEKDQSFQVCARKGPDVAGIKSGRLSVKDSLNGLVVRTGQPLVSHDAMTDPRANQARARRLHVRTVAIAPLKIRDRTIGTVAVHNKRDGYFSRADVEVLCSFANQAATAIDNARLFNELLRARDEIQEKAQELQEFLVQTINVQEDERRRIAADIHDRVVPLIVGTLYEVEACARCDQHSERTCQQLEIIQQLLNEAVEETRTAIYNLWPATLEHIGLIPALYELLGHQQKATSILHSLRTHGVPRELPAPVQVVVYRIVQEALNNIRQHAQATRVDMLIRFSPQRVRVVIQDNGQGFDVRSVLLSPPRRHFGLISMRERALSIGGKLSVDAAPNKGSKITLEIPVS
jgi:signal transduction histidine kinase